MWKFRSMNWGKLEVARQKRARININISGISELKWTGTGKFNLDDHFFYFMRNCWKNGSTWLWEGNSAGYRWWPIINKRKESYSVLFWRKEVWVARFQLNISWSKSINTYDVYYVLGTVTVLGIKKWSKWSKLSILT